MGTEVVIGKYTLESLTTGMYTNPFIIYREYVQNAADGIDEAVRFGLISYEQSYIRIYIDEENSSIIIEDNGIGVSCNGAIEALCNIGKSSKNPSSNKGFRGIGRLGGLSYCDKVIFETSYKGENKKTVVCFDAVKLNELLLPGKNDFLSISEVINEITSVKYVEESIDDHYFKVTLINVSRKFQLLDVDMVHSYLKQIAPVPYDLYKFEYAKDIYSKFNEFGVSYRDYNIYLGTELNKMKQIYKPYKTKFYTDVSRKIIDSFSGVHFQTITNDYSKKLVAIVWYGKCNLLGTVLDDEVKGLRVRKSGLLIGDRFLLNSLFKEERFNGWIQGEVHVLDDDIIVNARRDDFEKNDAYIFLMEKLKVIAETISSDIRNASKARNINNNTQHKNKENESSNINSQKLDSSKTNELINKLDLIIEKATISNDSILDKVYVLLKEEVEARKAETIINKIKKEIVCAK